VTATEIMTAVIGGGGSLALTPEGRIKGAVPPELVTEVHRHREEIAELLTTRITRQTHGGLVRCESCPGQHWWLQRYTDGTADCFNPKCPRWCGLLLTDNFRAVIDMPVPYRCSAQSFAHIHNADERRRAVEGWNRNSSHRLKTREQEQTCTETN
jgi:hypothetical protein